MIDKYNYNSFLHQSAEIEELISQLSAIREDMLRMAGESNSALLDRHPDYLFSAQNLLHYLALRSQDIRSLQGKLAQMGLSSLGRSELTVLATVDAVLRVLHQLVQRPWSLHSPILDSKAGQQLLREHTEALLGAPPADRNVRIMVTMPNEAADDYWLVYNLLMSGMNCMRINCAHDDQEIWSKVINNLRKAEKATNLSCQIMMDLAGPKLRTGSAQPKPAVIKIRPLKNDYGQIIRPARVWLFAKETPSSPITAADYFLPVEREWLDKLATGDRIKIQDARDARRTLKVIDVTEKGCLAEANKTAYIIPGTELVIHTESGTGTKFKTTIGSLPAKKNTIHLTIGDLLILEPELEYGRPAALDNEGNVISPAAIGSPAHEVFGDIRAGEEIWFDDGKIGGIVERAEADRLYVRITHTREGGHKLGGEKGINLPNSNLHLSAMTTKDVEDLKFVASHADIVALSFANSVEDVQLLRRHLYELNSQELGIVLKIETQRGFENLPSMLLEIMKVPRCGVMIARGDLAVECGFERMAEVQEEILWICEAAHVPVIWATQVLESMAKEGLPSRAEITDAAMGEGSECVMLNKGKHIVDTVKALDNILKRMQGHQHKKRSMMRELRLASTFREKYFTCTPFSIGDARHNEK
ncbi:pyruvate kinase [Paenibacillus durus]|uniref:Pyruvate kinase n=2 Tax=Paenibacillus durus TaxID=44251 RepID=A0A0F7CGA8_PAEDU|nr:pyruvate kinase [Paenibacillus durus]AKG33336.1 pyruvate kinase [Paenibacillus durus ATCC 35681]